MSLSALLALCFFACSLVCWLHVRQIIRDKAVKGVSLIPTFVFMTTNIVEMFYFADRHDWLSMLGGASMLLSNVAWTVCVFWYMHQQALEDGIECAFKDLSFFPECSRP